MGEHLVLLSLWLPLTKIFSQIGAAFVVALIFYKFCLYLLLRFLQHILQKKMSKSDINCLATVSCNSLLCQSMISLEHLT